jgi:hypothetical protein
MGEPNEWGATLAEPNATINTLREVGREFDEEA